MNGKNALTALGTLFANGLGKTETAVELVYMIAHEVPGYDISLIRQSADQCGQMLAKSVPSHLLKSASDQIVRGGIKAPQRVCTRRDSNHPLIKANELEMRIDHAAAEVAKFDGVQYAAQVSALLHKAMHPNNRRANTLEKVERVLASLEVQNLAKAMLKACEPSADPARGHNPQHVAKVRQNIKKAGEIFDSMNMNEYVRDQLCGNLTKQLDDGHAPDNVQNCLNTLLNVVHKKHAKVMFNRATREYKARIASDGQPMAKSYGGVIDTETAPKLGSTEHIQSVRLGQAHIRQGTDKMRDLGVPHHTCRCIQDYLTEMLEKGQIKGQECEEIMKGCVMKSRGNTQAGAKILLASCM